MTNCVNCGAVLHGSRCEYCGTVYSDNSISASFEEEDWIGTLSAGGKTYRVYIGEMEASVVCGPLTRRLPNGRLHRDNPVIKRKFTLIEV